MFCKSVSIDLVEPIICLRGQPKDKQTMNILRGAIRLQLSHSVMIYGINIQFVGISKTLWPEASQHWDKHILVDSTIPVCKSSVLLKKGTHCFPFEILLSNALSESIECGLGNVRYKLHCQVHVKPRFLLLIKSTLETQRPLVLIRLPSLETQQQCITQTHLINQSGGQLTLVIEKSHLTPGSVVPISFHFNASCQLYALDQITVKLIERQKYRAPSKQTNRILHHEIALSPQQADFDMEDNEIRTAYVVPDKHSIRVRASTWHPNIRVRHWIQISIRLALRDGSTKELHMDAPISVLLASVDEYLTLPVYDPSTMNNNNNNNNSSGALSSTSSSTKGTNSTNASPLFWLQKLYPTKHSYQHPNHVMSLITAPPPLYQDVL